jgi:putative endonuclease
MKAYFIYIMTNKGRTTLYVGVTNSLVRRVSQHRKGEVEGFTRKYNLTLMMYYEKYDDVRDAIRREEQIKGWTRKKKEELINSKNPQWEDLAVSVLGLGPAPETDWH